MIKLLSKLLKKTSSVTDNIPELRLHLSEQIIGIQNNYVCSVVEFKGIPFESISTSSLENDFDVLNLAYAETAKEKAGNLAFYNYFLRRKIDINNEYHFENLFCKGFSEKYMKRFNDKDYFENHFYICFVLKYELSQDEAIRELSSIVQRFCTTLSKYEPKVLSTYKNKQGILNSEVYEFFYEIINAEKPVSSCPLTGSPAYQILPSSNLHFGYEILEIKGVLKTRYATSWDLKDFPQETYLGMYNSSSLSLPFEYNLTHSFVSLSASKAVSIIDKKMKRLLSVGDKAYHQIDDLNRAQGFTQTGEIAMGEYHSSLIVFGESKEEAIKNGIQAIASFINNAGAVFAKATASAPATYLSQLPLYKIKPRPMMKSSRSLAGVFSLHNYSKGKAKGNPLGDGSAIMPLETVSKTLYDFNFHFTNINEDNTGEAIAGHTLILGATGTGKTTLQTALLTFLQRFNPAMFVLDKDRGTDIFIRALDGDYFNIEAGKPTGINPFQFEKNEQLIDFLNTLVQAIATDSQNACTSEEQILIKNAIDTVMDLPFESRRLGAILQSIPNRGGNSLYQRLLNWCYSEEFGEGRFAWVLDNPQNRFNPSNFKIVGFEVGEILKEDYQPTEPILACLLYMKNQMVQRFSNIVTVVEEFWLPLMYKTPQNMILDVLKTGRKRGEFMLLVSQSPEEAVKSPIFPAIVQQTPTKILLPNPDAEYKNEQGGGYSRVGLTEKEFNVLKKLTVDSRTFLIKQGQQSSFAKMDLYGFSKEINVLSSNKLNVKMLDTIIGQFKKQGLENPKCKDWLPVFYESLDCLKQYPERIGEFIHLNVQYVIENQRKDQNPALNAFYKQYNQSELEQDKKANTDVLIQMQEEMQQEQALQTE